MKSFAESCVRDKPFADLTTIGIGGTAAWFHRAETVQQLREAIAWSRANDLPLLILGGGSNMLVADSGWPGLVVQLGLTGIHIEDVADDIVRIISGAGEQWDDLVRYAVDSGLQGIECLAGIPGTVGASPIQNIGAYGQEVKDTIEWVEAVHRDSGEVIRFTNQECGFQYRWSRFKGEDRDRYVITRVAFNLRKNDAPTLRYGDLTRYFAAKNKPDPDLNEVREAVIEIRRAKGMVIDPAIPDSRSCGSFFMNPVLPVHDADRIRRQAESRGLLDDGQTMPEYPAGDGQVKLSAAWLMEKSGLSKGMTLGNVGLSSRHVLAIINCGDGTAAEVLTLVQHIQETVREQFGVDLHPEPVFIGFDHTQKGNR